MERFRDIEYRDEIEDLFRKIPVMTFKQLLKSVSLIAQCEINSPRVSNAVNMLARNGIVLISKNGLVTTKFALDIIAKGYFDLSIQGKVRLDVLNIPTLYKQCIDCFTLVLDMYPNSEDFEISKHLFQISFCHKGKNQIYELIRIPKNQENVYNTLILKDTLDMFTKLAEPEKLFCKLKRIAVVESKACAEYVPFCGFNAICVLNGELDCGYEIVEKRSAEDAWKDLNLPALGLV